MHTMNPVINVYRKLKKADKIIIDKNQKILPKYCKNQTCDNCKYCYQNAWNKYCEALPNIIKIGERTTPCIYYENKE